MERARATWTDERLDDLARRVDDGFNRVDEDLRSLRIDLGARIDGQGAELGSRIESLEGRLDARLDSLQRTMLQVGGGTIAAVLAAALSVIATQG